jgi:GNAT superfamily N-acetyltransferase
VTVPRLIIRAATARDARAVAVLAEQFATSFRFSPEAFGSVFEQLLRTADACLLVADVDVDGNVAGYLLGFTHPTFFANGPVGWIEEITVATDRRRTGLGHALTAQFETWASHRGSRLVALATRRADAFYQAIGYTPSATYLHKRLPDQTPPN